MSKVTVLIDPRTGEATYDVNGIMGSSCKTITDLLQQNQELLEEKEKEEMVNEEFLPEYLDSL